MLSIVSGHEVEPHHDLMAKVFRLRHNIFVDEKGWHDLRRPDGLERDCFDDHHAIHQVASVMTKSLAISAFFRQPDRICLLRFSGTSA